MQTFKVDRYKGLSGTVEVSTDGGSVIVQGKNAAGKSSFVDGITELFDTRGIKLTPRPIHDGEDEARAEFIDTDLDVRIVREWKRGKDGGVKSTLAVYALDGAKHAKPAEVIARLTGGVIFDPLKYLNMDPKPQRDMLLQKVELPFDLDQLEAEERAAVEERLQRGQAARAAEGAVTNADRPAPGTPAEPVSTQDLVAELDAANAHNRRIIEAESYLADVDAQRQQLAARILELEQALERARAEMQEAEGKRAELTEFLASSERVDTTGLQERIGNVDEINRNVQLGQILAKLEADAAEKRAEHEAADAAVKEIQQRKADGLKVAKFPHPSLSVSDEGVLFDGTPFGNLNTAQQREAAFAIATAAQPDLRLVLVKDGDMLDEESLAIIDRIAIERGYTVLVERGRPDVGGLIATFVEMDGGQQA